ncbi:hypothetical protein [Micromonospora sp. NPDC050495]|uniref:hypothetical protein n=1 Tax=Micromonospora sp. NPDC050495 TaxID=3154936 RepID=UPI00340636A3
MSARSGRPKRWEQWNRRPARVSLASRGRRERYTSEQLDAVVDTSMDAGVEMGRRFGERDMFRFLADDFLLREDATPEDVLDLAAYIGGQALAAEVDQFLLIEGTVRRDPDRMGQIAEAVELVVEEGKEALERLAREWGVFPKGDDLLDVADAAGVTPEADTDPVVVDLERWLREHGRDLPDDED